MAPAPGCATFLNGFYSQTGELMGQLGGIGHRGRAENKGRRYSVPLADAMKPSEDLSHMRSHYPAIGVDFINDHHVQSGQKRSPFAMVGQQRQMQHLRIGDDHIRWRFPNTFAAIGRRITIIDGTRWPRMLQVR